LFHLVRGLPSANEVPTGSASDRRKPNPGKGIQAAAKITRTQDSVVVNKALTIIAATAMRGTSVQKLWKNKDCVRFQRISHYPQDHSAHRHAC
jgi:hypothetical protein